MSTSGEVYRGVVEVDFGSTASRDKVFTVAEPFARAGAPVTATHSGVAATGKSADENEMDRLTVTATAADGSITMNCTSVQGPVVGAFKINYILQAT